MNASLLFWTVALVNLGLVCVVAILGVRYARSGEIARHKRAMKIASLLVVAFLGSYVLKVAFLGREDQSVWSLLDVWVLRIHELFVMIMMITGAIAWLQVRKLAVTRLVTHDPEDPPPDPRTMRIHRLAGRTAVISAVLGFLWAVGVLVGMYARQSPG